MKKCFKRCLTTALMLSMLVGLFSACGSKPVTNDDALTKVTLNEVAHSIFYAPMYVAMEEGFFAEEGIDLQLVTGFGADKTMPAVLTDEADIGLFLRRAMVLAPRYGSAAFHRARYAALPGSAS